MRAGGHCSTGIASKYKVTDSQQYKNTRLARNWNENKNHMNHALN